MPGSVNAGNIIYEVDMDTARLLAARREVDAALNGMSGNMGRLEASVNRTERSISSMERTMSSLSGVAKGIMAALTGSDPTTRTIKPLLSGATVLVIPRNIVMVEPSSTQIPSFLYLDWPLQLYHDSAFSGAGIQILRGEEFNSISENGSRLAAALTDSPGVAFDCCVLPFFYALMPVLIRRLCLLLPFCLPGSAHH